MRRREFIAGLGAAVAWPLAARAQQAAMPVIGYLHSGSPVGGVASDLAAFLRGLNDAGYVEGKNVTIEYRWADSRPERLPALAGDLVRRQVAVIVAAGGDQPAQAAKAATATIPIVFLGAGNALETGLVTSLNRPGANMTGIIFDNNARMAKRVELLHELVPSAKTVALLVRPTNRGGPGWVEANVVAAQAAVAALGLQLHVVTFGSDSELDATFATLAQQRIGALMFSNDVFFSNHRDQIAALAARYRIPTSHYRRDLVDAGVLMSYGASIPDGYRQGGLYAGRVLKGEKPADLPILTPAKFELVINLKTAMALGLDVPPSFYWRADEVIE